MKLLPGVYGRVWFGARRFIEKPSRVVLMGVSAFASATSEAGVLVLLALGAASLLNGEDKIVAAGLTLTSVQAMLLALGLLIVRTAAAVVSSVLPNLLGRDVMWQARSSVLRSFLHASWAARDERELGELQEVAGSHVEQVAALSSTIAGTVNAFLSLTTFVAASLILNPRAALAMAVVGIVLVFAMRPLTRRTKRAAKSYTSSSKGMATQITDTALLARDIETYAVSEAVIESLDDVTERVSRLFGRTRFLYHFTPQIFQIIVLGLAVCGLLTISLMSSTGSLASVGAVAMLLLRVASAGQQVVGNTQNLLERVPYLESLNESIDRLSASTLPLGVEHLAAPAPLVVDGVSFRYGDSEVLRDVSFELHQGEAVGIVGPSGSGKSTLVQLILRLREPTNGQIRASGTPLSEIIREEWAAAVAFVPQDPILFHGSVLENVQFFRDIDRTTALDALRAAHVLDEIDLLPDGVDTILARGSTVSGGQRQRIAIARALAGRPQLIVMDEPTASLDPISERRVQQTLADLQGRVSLLIVAHRHSTIAACDRVLVLKDGKREALASPQQLIAQKGSYFEEAFQMADIAKISEDSDESLR
jgi:ATP-binding cassette subfamily B protein